MPPRQKRRSAADMFPVVGIGASAGGLEAFTELVQSLPPDTGMAFVLLQHMAADAKTMLGEILERSTSMPVLEATDGLEVRPDHVYVMPASADLEILERKLVLVPRGADLQQHLPIDRFFRSLAADQHDRAVGVVLSGSGSDGTAGLTAIKSAGGVTFAQDPASAGHNDMPRHAMESGAADFVLRPEEIARELARLAGQLPATEPRTVPEPEDRDHEALLRQVFLALRRETGMDFSGYKRASFARRLSRRMLVRRTEDLEDYVRLLKQSPEEVQALYQDILIMVTEFFRDPATFDYLKADVFPRLVSAKEPGTPLRLWVVGCSSGQEAYSFAITLLEYLGDSSSHTVQIFGTDINEKDIEQARSGVYPPTIASEMSPERLRRFFSKVEGGYRVNHVIREMCTFARHDLTRDPPFSNVDFLSCRNVLIYFDTVLQERVIPVFHYALVAGGVLLLGSSESIGRRSELFEVLDRKHHVFVSRAVPARLPLELGPSIAPHSLKIPHPSASQPEKPLDSQDVQREFDQMLAQAYAPASVLVDETYHVLSFRGLTSPYLEHRTGRASFDVFQMAREGLGYELRRALQEAKETMTPVRKAGLRVGTEGARRALELEVRPFRFSDGLTYFVVSFRQQEHGEAKPAARASAPAAPEKPGEEAVLLRRELEASREHLQVVLAEKDTGTEELRAAYEELQSGNEELQSTNEELETAKEELQSTNEELHTVNDELAARNLELGHAHDDLANLLASVNIPMVMLDRDLRVRRFTPGTEVVLHLIDSDIGRPISHLRLKVDAPDLEVYLRQAIDSLSSSTHDVRGEEGRWYSLRVRPYKTGDGRIEGAVLSFIDVDELKRSLEATAQAKRLSEALNDIDLAINSTFEFDEIMRRVMTRSSKALRSESGLVLLAQGQSWGVRQVQGLPKKLVGTVLADREVPQAGLARTTRLPVIIEDAVRDERITPRFRERFGVPYSELVVPLLRKDEVLGVLIVNRASESAGFTEAEVAFAAKLAAAVSLGLQNARLYGDLRETEELGRALRDILSEIAATHDVEKSMPQLLEEARRSLGADGSLCSFRYADTWEVGHVVGFSSELQGRPWGAKEALSFPVSESLIQPLTVSDSDDQRIDTSFFKEHEIASAFVVPLLLSEVLFGLLLFGFCTPGRTANAAETNFLAKLSGSISLGLEKSRLFQAEHRLAESLRRQMTPTLPQLSGLQVGAAVHMAAEIEKVGGDFYDLFPLDEDRIFFLVGDVTGKGLPAAELTQVIRSSTRALALIDPSPGFILDTINRIIRERNQGTRVATARFVLLKQSTGELQMGGAGHPPALICGASCRLFDTPPAPPLGFARDPYRPSVHTLEAGETLILYTDGLTESRRGKELYGEKRLLSASRSLVAETPQIIADTLLKEASDFAGGKLNDDVAILAVRRSM